MRKLSLLVGWRDYGGKKRMTQEKYDMRREKGEREREKGPEGGRDRHASQTNTSDLSEAQRYRPLTKAPSSSTETNIDTSTPSQALTPLVEFKQLIKYLSQHEQKNMYFI